jgi:hypothetical protein
VVQGAAALAEREVHRVQAKWTRLLHSPATEGKAKGDLAIALG